MNQGEHPLEQVASCRDVTEYHDDVGPLKSGEIRPGTLLDQRFLIGEPLSRSGMAMIYKAEDTHRQNQTVVVKVPHLKCESDPVSYSRFHREAEIGAKLDHPFLLKFIPVAQPQSRPYIVTEYLRGRTLAHILQAMCPLPEKDALRIASLVCEALQAMHTQGIIHRDLKPDNIMICSDRTIRLMDFGLAEPLSLRHGLLSRLTTIIGTPQYMAPEQVKNTRNDERTDIYSLGVILYEMLTGELPFPGEEDAWETIQWRVTGDPVAPRQVNPAVSPEAEEIVLHAMQREPTERFQSAQAFQAELDAPERVAITGYCERLQKPRWRMSFQTTPILAGIVVGVAALLGFTGLFFVLCHVL